jgi:hypothetical protein
MDIYKILESLSAIEKQSLTESRDAEFDADSLAKHKSKLAREKNRAGMTQRMSGSDLAGSGNRADVPAALRKAKGEKPLTLQDLKEDNSDNPVMNAIVRRILASQLNLIKTHGVEAVYSAIIDVADDVGDVYEIGTSDVSGWVSQVIEKLKQSDTSGMEEGNEFSGKLANARMSGADSFKVGNKDYTVKESKGKKPDFLDVDKDGDKKEPMKKAAADKKKGAAPKKGVNPFAKKSAVKEGGYKRLDTDRIEKAHGHNMAAAQRAMDRRQAEGEDMSDYKIDPTTYEIVKAKKKGVSEGYSDFFDKKMAYQKIGAMVDGQENDYIVTLKDGTRKRYITKDSRRQVTALSPVNQLDDKDDDTPRAAGRPKGTGRRMGAKGPSVSSKLLTGKNKGGLKEQDIDIQDHGEYDREGDMALNQLQQIADAVDELHSILSAEDNLPEWVQSKITKAVDYLDTARDYLSAKDGQLADSDDEDAEQVNEKAKARLTKEESMKQVATDKKDSDKDEVEETTTAGSVATGGEKPAKGNSIYGKGVYESALAESYSNKLNAILSESISINTSTDDSGQRSITVTATDEHADQLAEMLKMAGMSGGHASMNSQQEPTCDECGGLDDLHEAECSHNMNEEYNNAPNELYGDMDMMLNKLSGGLNGPKKQVNPNNPGDNPLAMKRLGKAPSGQVDLGAMSEQVEADSRDRLTAMYKKYR